MCDQYCRPMFDKSLDGNGYSVLIFCVQRCRERLRSFRVSKDVRLLHGVSFGVRTLDDTRGALGDGPARPAGPLDPLARPVLTPSSLGLTGNSRVRLIFLPAHIKNLKGLQARVLQGKNFWDPVLGYGSARWPSDRKAPPFTDGGLWDRLNSWTTSNSLAPSGLSASGVF